MDNLHDFELTEECIKAVHSSLMSHPSAWETGFREELVGNYRNIPTIGSRQPFFEDKEYVSHFNLDIVMATRIEMINNHLRDIDNRQEEKHLLTRIAYFHNTFLNEIHPFADGNGRVCRIMIGGILMKNGCPPIFPEITDSEQQINYITTIVMCENEGNNKPLVSYLAEEMTKYMKERILSITL